MNDGHLRGFNAFLFGAERYAVGRRALEAALGCEIEAPEARLVAVTDWEFGPRSAGDAKRRCQAA